MPHFTRFVTQQREFMPHFTRFVTQFLSHRDNSSFVSKFKFCSDLTATDSRFVEKCIEYAISHGVQELDLDVYCSPTRLKFSANFFACKTLRILKLKQYADSLVILNTFFLPNITTLQLESFYFKGGNDPYSFLKEPFSCFPNLEELTLHRCEVDGLIISSSKLKILELSFQDMLFSREIIMERISAPMVTSFRYKGYVSLVCPVIDLPCLEEVYFHHFAVLEATYTDDIAKKMPLNLIRTLQQLGNAKFVTLTMRTIEILAMDLDLLEQNASPFSDLKHLKLKKKRYDSNFTAPENVMNYLTMGSLHSSSPVVQSSIV